MNNLDPHDITSVQLECERLRAEARIDRAIRRLVLFLLLSAAVFAYLS